MKTRLTSVHSRVHRVLKLGDCSQRRLISSSKSTIVSKFSARKYTWLYFAYPAFAFSKVVLFRYGIGWSSLGRFMRTIRTGRWCHNFATKSRFDAKPALFAHSFIRRNFSSRVSVKVSSTDRLEPKTKGRTKN